MMGSVARYTDAEPNNDNMLRQLPGMSSGVLPSPGQALLKVYSRRPWITQMHSN